MSSQYETYLRGALVKVLMLSVHCLYDYKWSKTSIK